MQPAALARQAKKQQSVTDSCNSVKSASMTSSLSEEVMKSSDGWTLPPSNFADLKYIHEIYMYI